jgi:hypothetical protein
MHDIDSTRLELESDHDEYEADAYEYEQPRDPRYSESEATVFSEADEMELAAELLATSDEQELDQFLGELIGKAGASTGRPVKGGIGKKLGGFLKGAFKKIMPTVAGAAGTLFGGPLVGMAASKLTSAAGNALGLELEGLSPEDQEFEAARHFVRFAADAARHAGKARPADDPQEAAKKAVVMAARKFAPGLLRQAAAAVQSETAAPRGDRPGHTGRWIRQGQKIVLLGV